MKLEKLYETKSEDGKTLIAIGNGSLELAKLAKTRIGVWRFYVLIGSAFVEKYGGSSNHLFFFLKEKDFKLFNAYDILPEGYEIFDRNEDIESKNEKFLYYNSSQHRWLELAFKINHLIYARKIKPRRDFSAVQHILNRLKPDIKEEVIKLATESHNPRFPAKPTDFEDLFYWENNSSSKTCDYWRGLNVSLRWNLSHEDILAEFKWIKDRLPTKEDADVDGFVVYYYSKDGKGFSHEKYDSCLIEAGMPWQTVEACKQFTKENPAPSPFDQEN